MLHGKLALAKDGSHKFGGNDVPAPLNAPYKLGAVGAVRSATVREERADELYETGGGGAVRYGDRDDECNVVCSTLP